MNAAAIAEVLRQEIVTGVLRPGEELPQQRLAERFDVSRIPIRDAIILLAAEGIITAQPNRGARVLSLAPEEIEEIYALRILLECDCLSVAMANATDEDLAAARRCLRHTNIDAQTDSWADSDWTFHATLYRPANRPRQIDMIHRLRQFCRVHLVKYDHLKHGTSQWLKDHTQIVDCYCDGETSKAVAVLRRHLTSARDFLMEAMSS